MALYISGWVLNIIGLALWLFGYFTNGTEAMVDWPGTAPAWISDYIPNLQAEIGLIFMIVGAVPLFMTPSRQDEAD